MRRIFATLAVTTLTWHSSPGSAETATTDGPLVKAIAEQLSRHPELIFDVIQQNPEAFITAANNASVEYKRLAEQRSLDQAFGNPLQPLIEADRIVFGAPEAPVTIVEYSDFECPYCARISPVLERVLEEYRGQVRLVYKHLPLGFHALALPAAKYFEAIALQDPAKARAFHDQLFRERKQFTEGGEDYLQQLALDYGVDMQRLNADRDSDAVAARIQADADEARGFGINGTPGFLVNGVLISGAQPFEAFQRIIDRHLASAAASRSAETVSGGEAPAHELVMPSP